MSKVHLSPAVNPRTDPIIRALEVARLAQNVSVEELEERSGVSLQTVKNWRIGRRSPTLSNLQAVANTLGLRIYIGPDR